MDEKFRKILERALHPSTHEGEWDSAFRAARRMAGANSLEKLLGAPVQPQTREVVRERVVYREPRYTHHMDVTLKISARWQHSFMEMIWKDAQSAGLKIEVIHLRTREKTLNSGLDLRVKIHGGPNGLKWWDSRVDGYLKEMNSKNRHGTAPLGPDVTGETVPKRPGFWRRLAAVFKG
jgi:hypothetical protein